MRVIERTNAFKRDYKRESKGRHGRELDGLLVTVVSALAQDEVLEAAFRDHASAGSWVGHRDCHVRPDLVLIYRLVGSAILVLVRLGSHSELFR